MFEAILQNKVTAGVAMVIILGLAWYGLTGTSAPPPILQKDANVAAGSEEIVATLLALRAVTLSGTIFADPVFMSLQDFGVEIRPEPVGRENPFLPLVQTQVQQKTPASSRSTQIFAPTKR